MVSIGQRSVRGQVTASGLTASAVSRDRVRTDFVAASALILAGSVLAGCGIAEHAERAGTTSTTATPVSTSAPAPGAPAPGAPAPGAPAPGAPAPGGQDSGRPTEAVTVSAHATERSFLVDDPGDRPDAMPGDGICATVPGVDGGGCTLRAAVEEANASPGADRIVVGVAAVSLGGRDLDITEAVTIRGRRHATGQSGPAAATIIDAHGLSRVFDICPDEPANGAFGCADPAAVVVELRDMTLRGGRVRGSGGAIRNSATLHLRHVVLRDSEAAEFGGAVFNDGNLLLADTTIRDSRAGFYGGGLFNRGRAALDGTSVDGNAAGVAGGGIANFGILDLADATVTANESPTVGAGLYDGADPRSVTARETTIRGNRITASPASATVLQHAVDSFAVWTPTLVAEAL